MVRSVRASHSSTSAVDSSGRAPGCPVTSSTRASTSSGSTVTPWRWAGRVMARRYSSAVIGPTSTWLAAIAEASRWSPANRP